MTLLCHFLCIILSPVPTRCYIHLHSLGTMKETVRRGQNLLILTIYALVWAPVCNSFTAVTDQYERYTAELFSRSC